VDLIVTDTDETASLLLLFDTLPDTVTACCALTAIEKAVAKQSNKTDFSFLIRLLILLNYWQNSECMVDRKIFIFPNVLKENISVKKNSAKE
jgi:hypothetical protein